MMRRNVPQRPARAQEGKGVAAGRGEGGGQEDLGFSDFRGVADGGLLARVGVPVKRASLLHVRTVGHVTYSARRRSKNRKRRLDCASLPSMNVARACASKPNSCG